MVAFPELTGTRQVTADGGSNPFWSSDGHELFFRSAGTLMSARVSTEGGVFRWDPPQPLFNGLVYGVTPDGDRFLAVRANPDSWAEEIHVVTNWFQVLKGKEGGGGGT